MIILFKMNYYILRLNIFPLRILPPIELIFSLNKKELYAGVILNFNSDVGSFLKDIRKSLINFSIQCKYIL